MFVFLLYSLRSSLTTYDLEVGWGVTTSALFQVSQNFIWLDRRLEMSAGFHSFSCRSRTSAPLDDWPCHCDVPWNFRDLVVGVRMSSAALSSTVDLETVEQGSIQCREDCFCSQAVLCMVLVVCLHEQAFTSLYSSFYLSICLWVIKTGCCMFDGICSPSWTEQIQHKQTEVRCPWSLHLEFHIWRSDTSCMRWRSSLSDCPAWM